jgi:hypothetical protein
MSNISKKLEQVVNSAQKKLIQQDQILPVKTAEGILVGNVLIVSNSSIKDLWQHGEIVYASVYLNAVAIRLANLAARKINKVAADAIYREDQEYGKWFVDSQLLRVRFQQSLETGQTDRADIYWARYCESRDRAMTAKKRVQSLIEK